MDGEKVLVLFILFLLPVSCSRQVRQATKVIEECGNRDIEFGCLVISVNRDEFIIIDNDILRSRVYYDNYYNLFDDYSDFLFTALNYSDVINYSLVINPNHYYSNSQYKIITNLPHLLFKGLFLRKTRPGVYTPQHYTSRTLPYILRKCYDLGYYIYTPGYSGQWIIEEAPVEGPPILQEEDSAQKNAMT
ncbi:MAG: hypothetical protein J6W94_06315 [Bacteroidales bacterium]|nr:hypothetical protein [Bacteroidales bacterium]